MSSLEVQLKARAGALGFALAGIAPATEADGFARYREWLDRGFAGEMDYLHRFVDARHHPSSILEGVRSVLMVAMEYGRTEPPHSQTVEATIPSRLLPKGRVAAYAQGPDYHRFIWDRLNELVAWLEAEAPGCRAAAVADTAPLLERDFARRAGLGWIGKNTMLIHPRRGSFFFLGALLTDLELAPDASFSSSHCGSCTACLDACPTKAFPQPFVLDASRCVSYLTIELRGPVPEELREPMGNWLYGCDVCQDVCPWNGKREAGTGPFPHDPEMASLDPLELLTMDANTFRVRFKKTSLWRNRRAGLLRNAAIVLGNVGNDSALPALQQALADPEELIRDAAAWAIEQICQRASGVNRK